MASSAKDKIKFMTYNVWSNEHVAVYRRIHAISELIERHDPDVIFLQEVTEYIFSLFQEAPWWTQYKTFSSKDKKQSVARSDAPQPQIEYSCLLVNAWTKLNGCSDGWTYDSFWNEKAGEFNFYRASNVSMLKRSDRFVCKLKDYTLKTVELIWDQGVGIQYFKKYDGYDTTSVDLRPSCHRELVLTVVTY